MDRWLNGNWGQRLREVFDSIEDPQWNGGATEVPICVDPTRSRPIRKITNPRDKLI